jgi:hypothetical protein
MSLKKFNRDRVRECRARKAAEGGRAISVMLEPQTAHKLDVIRKHYGRSKKGRNAPFIAMAIEALYQSIINQ